MENYIWNPVYNKILEIKNRYQKEILKRDFIDTDYLEYDGYSSVVNLWLEKLADEELTKMFLPVNIKQKGFCINVKYGKFAIIFAQEGIEYDSFWEAYDGFYRHCRTIVIDLKDEVIAGVGFKKFMNIGETEEDSMENVIARMKVAKKVEIATKLDGSMQVVFYHNGIVDMVGSSSMDEEESPQLMSGKRYLAASEEIQKMSKENPDLSFIFEHIDSTDPHVVIYPSNMFGLHLIGIRENKTGIQYSYDEVTKFAQKYNVETINMHNKSFEEILEDVKALKSNDFEGFVINIDGYMCKLKCEDYLRMQKVVHALKSQKVIIHALCNDTIDDIIANVPEAYKYRINSVLNIISMYEKEREKELSSLYSTFESLKIESEKDKAIWINQNTPKEYKAFMFAKIRKKPYSFIKPGQREVRFHEIVDYLTEKNLINPDELRSLLADNDEDE